jgi:hypothetical protein
MILQIYREHVKTGCEADYASLEQDTARIAMTLRCPNPYLAAESLTGPKAVWWFNAYESPEAQKRVALDYMKNAELMDRLQRNSSRKVPWTYDASDMFAYLRPQLSAGASWEPGQGRYLSITEGTGADQPEGTVFETAEGLRFVIAAFATRADASAHSPRAHLLAVRPEWSFPSRRWIDADPQFWAVQRPSQVLARPAVRR